MTTLIKITTSHGLGNQCDARCYNATNDRCACVCGGANHGVGFAKACENTRKLHESMVESFVEQGNIADYEVMLNVTVVRQMRMPLSFRVDK